MLDFNDSYQDIIDKLKSDLAPVPVYESSVPINVEKEAVNGMFSPYLVISIGGGIRERGGRHVANMRMDTLAYWVTVVCVAPDDDVARMLKGEVLNSLTAFVPTDGSPLSPEGGQAQSVANENRIPAIFQHRVMFKFSGNMISETA